VGLDYIPLAGRGVALPDRTPLGRDTISNSTIRTVELGTSNVHLAEWTKDPFGPLACAIRLQVEDKRPRRAVRCKPPKSFDSGG
jgi:hypothetical protein